ncbi:MAG: T9SS type A sorting domain-containing protein [Bacteroidetes bacterium]|nr:T9SS type A sorting domain-containing protein [Bacteroidota bacterium]
MKRSAQFTLLLCLTCLNVWGQQANYYTGIPVIDNRNSYSKIFTYGDSIYLIDSDPNYLSRPAYGVGYYESFNGPPIFKDVIDQRYKDGYQLFELFKYNDFYYSFGLNGYHNFCVLRIDTSGKTDIYIAKEDGVDYYKENFKNFKANPFASFGIVNDTLFMCYPDEGVFSMRSYAFNLNTQEFLQYDFNGLSKKMNARITGFQSVDQKLIINSFDADNLQIVNLDPKIIIYDLVADSVVSILKGKLNHQIFLKNDTICFHKTEAIGSYSPRITMLDLKTGLPTYNLNSSNNPIRLGSDFKNYSFKNNGVVKASATDVHGDLYFSAQTTPLIVRKLDCDFNMSPTFRYEDTSETSEVFSMLADENKLWLGGKFDILNYSKDSLIRILDTATGKVIKSLISATGEVTSMAQDENFIYASGYFKINYAGRAYEHHLRISKSTLKIDTNWVLTKIPAYSKLFIKDSFLILSGDLFVSSAGKSLKGHLALNRYTGDTLNLLIPRDNPPTEILAVSSDTLLYATEQGVFRLLNSSSHPDTLLHQNQIRIVSIIRKKDTLFIAYYTTVADGESKIIAFNIKTLQPLEFNTLFDEKIATLNFLCNSLFAGGYFSSSNMLPAGSDAGQLMSSQNVLKPLKFTGDSIPESYPFEITSRLKSDSLLFDFPINYKDKLYVKITDVKNGIIKVVSLNTLPLVYASNWLHYTCSSFDVDGDWLYALRNTSDTIDVFNLSSPPQHFAFNRGGKFTNISDRKILMDNGKMLITNVDKDIQIFSSGVSGVNLHTRQPLGNLLNIPIDKINDAINVDSFLLLSCEYKGDKAVSRINLKTGEYTVLYNVDDLESRNSISQHGDTIFFYDLSNNLCSINFRTPGTVVKNVNSLYGKMIDARIYASRKLSSQTNEIYSTDVIHGGLKSECIYPSSENLIGGISNIYKTSNHCLSFFTRNTSSGRTTYRLANANGEILIQRDIPKILLMNSTTLLTFQQVGDFLVFKQPNPVVNPYKMMAFHLPTGLIDSTFFYWDTDSSTYYYLQKSGNQFEAIGAQLEVITEPDGSRFYKDVVFSRFNFLPKTEARYYEHQPHVGGASKLDFKISTAYMPGYAYFYFTNGTDTIFIDKQDIVNKNGAELSAIVDFRSRSGSFDLVIVIPSDTTLLIPNAVFIETATSPVLKLSLQAHTYLRKGLSNSTQLTITNTGNTDALLIPLLIHTNGNLTITPLTDVVKDSTLKIIKYSDYQINSIPVSGDRNTLVLIPEISANSNVKLELNFVSSTEGVVPYEIRIGNPLLGGVNRNWDSSEFRMIQHYMNCEFLGDTAKQTNCFNEIFKNRLAGNLASINESIWLTDNTFLTDPNRAPQHAVTHVINVADYTTDFVKCVKTSSSDWGLLGKRSAQTMILKLMNQPLSDSCDLKDSKGLSYTCIDSIVGSFTVINSLDPNIKSGPLGFNGTRFVKQFPEDAGFRIQFENDKSASAPAQHIVITDTLDLNLFDLSTLRFNAIKLGSSKYVINNSTDRLNHLIPVTSIYDIALKTTSYLDTKTGVLQIDLLSVNAETGKAEDVKATEGLLPPNNSDDIGLGFVDFEVKFKPGVSPVTAKNSASIVFDYNQPIQTNTWELTADTTAPVSSISSVTSGINSYAEVHWKATDNVSEEYHYDIYKSENNGPFKLWLYHTTSESAYLSTTCGVEYNFFSIATDKAGNTENMKVLSEYSFTPDCSIVNQLDINLEIKGSRKGSQSFYVGENDKQVNYVVNVALKNPSDTSYWIKDVLVKLNKNPLAIKSCFIDSVIFNGTKYFVNKSLMNGSNKLLSLNTSFGRVEYWAIATDSSINLTVKALTSNGEEYVEGNIDGIAELKSSLPVKFSWYLRQNIDWTFPHLSEFTFDGIAEVNGGFMSDPAKSSLIMDKLAPNTTLRFAPTGGNNIQLHWGSEDQHSGLKSYEISLYKDGTKLFTSTRIPSDTSYNLTLSSSAVHKFVVLATDSVGNVEIEDSENTIDNLYQRLLGIENPSVLVKVFPNPADHYITIIPTPVFCRIYSVSGELLVSNPSAENGRFFIGELPEGLYFLEVHYKDQTGRFPLMISR